MTLRMPQDMNILFHFNPHEREARDVGVSQVGGDAGRILIHTSVKLVTYCPAKCS